MPSGVVRRRTKWERKPKRLPIMKSLQRGLAVLVIAASILASQFITPLSDPPSPPSAVTPHCSALPHKERLYYQPGSFRPGNLHFVFSSKAKKLKVYNYRGELFYQCRCCNETYNLGFLHWGQCPKGTFRLGRAVVADLPAFGPYFIPLYDLSPTGPMHRHGRHGIGLHGGGSRLCQPFAEFQELLRTHGCLRVTNHDVKLLVKFVHKARKKGRVSYITVQ
jgi:hypothetical protein